MLHWNYFIAIESDLEKLSRCIEFSKNNFKTYSIELARLLLSASSEVDVVAKTLCKRYDPTKKATKIVHYQNILAIAIPKIKTLKVMLPIYGLELEPWKGWAVSKQPQWWTAHNAVKHDRSNSFHEASLENTLNALAGLYVLLLYVYEKEAKASKLFPNPKFLQLNEKFSKVSLSDWGPLKTYRIY